ncbi:MAG: DUF3090 family protein [Nitrososphaerales archaeon]
MANTVVELDPVSHITAGAIGKPGQRTFFIQAEKGLERVTLVCEKEQVQALADAVDEMVMNLEQEFGLARHENLKVDENAMQVKEDEPLFRVGAMGLGYDANRDKILLVAQEALAEEEAERDPREVRLFATRAQMQVVSQYAREVIGKGRNPDQVVLQSEAHFRRNGHGDS